MPIFEMSAGVIPGYLTRSSSSNGSNGIGGEGIMPANDPGVLRIMKGTVPTNFTGIGYRYPSDMLIQFAYNGNITVNGSSNPIKITNTTYVSATANGIATWFWSESYSSWQQFIGTVGTLGSGADLEIPDVNIVTTRVYSVRDIKILLPTSWSW